MSGHDKDVMSFAFHIALLATMQAMICIHAHTQSHTHTHKHCIVVVSFTGAHAELKIG